VLASLLVELELISNPKPKLLLKRVLFRRKRMKNNGKYGGLLDSTMTFFLSKGEQ
jgi:hypothetical protein